MYDFPQSFETSPLPSRRAFEEARRLNPSGSLPTLRAPVTNPRTRESERARHEAGEPKWADGRKLRARLFASAATAIKERFGMTLETRDRNYLAVVRFELGRETDKTTGTLLVVARESGGICYYIVPAFGGYELWEGYTLDHRHGDEKKPLTTARSTATTDARATLLTVIAQRAEDSRKPEPPKPEPPVTAARGVDNMFDPPLYAERISHEAAA